MIADLHAHFPMHLLPPRQADTHAWVLEPRPGSRWRAAVLEVLSRLFNYEGPRGAPGVTVELMRRGDVGAVLSVLYAPFDEMDLTAPYGAPPRSGYADSVRRQIELVEEDLAREAAGAAIARDPGELDAALDAGRVAFVHCVEGGFALGATEAEVAANVADLAARGVAYVGLAHLFWRGVAENAPALPFLPDPLYRVLFPQPGDAGLSPLGEAAVRAMAEHHVLVDITHMNSRAIDDTLRLLGTLPDPPPLIASHIACRFAGGPEYNLTDEVIGQVGERGGVLGVTVSAHWAGARLPKAKDFDGSVRTLFAHIDRIREVTGSDDTIAIGSDLDGYIKPALPGLEHMGRMRALQDALVEHYGAQRAERYCSGNVLALLRRYWRGGS